MANYNQRGSVVALKQKEAFELIHQYQEHQSVIIPHFLSTFESKLIPRHRTHGYKKYVIQLQEIVNFRRKSLVIDVGDVAKYWEQLEKKKDEKAQHANRMGLALIDNTNRYSEFFHHAAVRAMPTKDQDFNESGAALSSEYERLKNNRENAQRDPEPGRPNILDQMNSKYLYAFDVRFESDKLPHVPLRNVRAQHLGTLVSVSGIISKTSLVQPKMEIAQYECKACLGSTMQMVEGDSFTPLKECNTPTCETNKTAALELDISRSKFIAFQECKIQENADEVPTGSVPRSMTLHITGDLCRKVVQGDFVTISGTYNIMKLAGPSFIGTQSIQFLLAHSITKHKQGYKDTEDDAMDEQISAMREVPDLYGRLADSIAPEIFGLHDVKKALLLALIGGSGVVQKDGMKIRGDIHVLLMGDPGVAKSQLLKQMVKIAPRSIYTTGKGTSGVGLTAAMIRDPRTKEITLEGGALVLADRGLCAIDEFDKMEETDRAAIHEVMEQQILSLAKAGITTTLNARCSVVAAANPIYGRYNPNKSPMDNMAMPAALLSRFDLKFLLLDHTQEEKDIELATHVLNVHRFISIDEIVPLANEAQVFEPELLRAYIKRAKKFNPLIPSTLKKSLIDKYVTTRQKERGQDIDDRTDYTSPRSLLGLLRLCQALARLRCSHLVNNGDYEEAIRLIEASKESLVIRDDDDHDDAPNFFQEVPRPTAAGEMELLNPDDMRAEIRNIQARDTNAGVNVQADAGQNIDELTGIYDIIRAELLKDGGGAVFDNEMAQKVTRRGYSEEDYRYCIEYYMDLRVLCWSNDEKTAYRFVES